MLWSPGVGATAGLTLSSIVAGAGGGLLFSRAAGKAPPSVVRLTPRRSGHTLRSISFTSLYRFIIFWPPYSFTLYLKENTIMSPNPTCWCPGVKNPKLGPVLGTPGVSQSSVCCCRQSLSVFLLDEWIGSLCTSVHTGLFIQVLCLRGSRQKTANFTGTSWVWMSCCDFSLNMESITNGYT